MDVLEDLAFIYRYHRYKAQLERRHEPPEAAIEDAAGVTEGLDAFSAGSSPTRVT